MSEKPVHAKPSLYANYFYIMRSIAFRYGYNLVIHGSMQRDLDLVALPWIAKAKPPEKMIKAISKAIGGEILRGSKDMHCAKFPHGRLGYVINLARFDKAYYDRQYYIDISVYQPTDKPS